MRLQAQKSGSGAQAFDFLSNADAKKSMVGEIDNGFTSAQMQVLDDTSEVSMRVSSSHCTAADGIQKGQAEREGAGNMLWIVFLGGGYDDNISCLAVSLLSSHTSMRVIKIPPPLPSPMSIIMI